MQLNETPFLATHLSGDTAWVDVLFVPAPLRRQGFGRRIFEAWTRQLPAAVNRIQLLAMDLDGGSPLGFWDKMGFSPEDADFPELLNGSYMVKLLRSATGSGDPADE